MTTLATQPAWAESAWWLLFGALHLLVRMALRGGTAMESKSTCPPLPQARRPRRTW